MTEQAPLILSLDTATRCSSVALTRGKTAAGEVLAQISFSTGITHSRRLLNSVETLLQETETDWVEIDAVAVGLGPGSFTGLRIGMATAKGFAVAAGKKLLGVSTLDALASMCVTEKRICAVIDARKKQVYCAFYRFDEQKGPLPEGKVLPLSPQQLIDQISEPVLMIGDGVVTYGELFKNELGSLVTYAPFHLHVPSAAAIGLLCGILFEENRYLDIGTAAPVYVRASDAELSLVTKKKMAAKVQR